MLKDGEDDHAPTTLLRSRPRVFWPAARRTLIEPFSDGVVLSWPPACAHATDGWTLAVCSDGGDGGDGGDESRGCEEILLTGESPLHLSPLPSCSLHSIRLLASSQTPKEEGGEKENDSDALWSFEKVRTLPRPDFEITAGHRELRLRILQRPQCHPEALVRHWRVTRCNHVPGEEEGGRRGRGREGRAAKARTEEEKEEEEEEEEEDLESSGDGDGGGDEDDYYYYDEAVRSGVEECSNSRHSLDDEDREEDKNGATVLRVFLPGLSECTLYSVDLTPTDDLGRALQPGERFGTVHSTLCGHGEGGTEKEGEEKGFWFEDGQDGGESNRDMYRRYTVIVLV